MTLDTNNWKHVQYCLQSAAIWTQITVYTIWSKKNCTVKFFQQLCQNFIYYENFGHTYYILNKFPITHPCIPCLFCLYNNIQGTRLFWIYSYPAHRARTLAQPSSGFVARRRTSIIAPNLAVNTNIPYLVPKITESRQCYRSGSIKILCEITMSWGDVWMTVGQTSSRRSNDWSATT